MNMRGSVSLTYSLHINTTVKVEHDALNSILEERPSITKSASTA